MEVGDVVVTTVVSDVVPGHTPNQIWSSHSDRRSDSYQIFRLRMQQKLVLLNQFQLHGQTLSLLRNFACFKVNNLKSSDFT